jgi:hypothetical protein
LFFSVILPAAVFLGSASLIEAATYEVINTNDSGAGTLRQTVLVAVSGGDTIVFAPSLNGQTITLTSGEITVKTNLTISGPGSALLTVSGNNASRVFDFKGGVSTISGLTIAHGRVAGGNGITGDGGGGGGGGMGAGLLADTSSTVSIQDVTFASNTVIGGNGGGNEGAASGDPGAAGGAGNGGSSGATAGEGQLGNNSNGGLLLGGAPGANSGGGGGGTASGIGAASPGGNGSYGGGGGGGGGNGGYAAPGGAGGTSAGLGGAGGAGAETTTGGGGGGGAGLGGAICVWQSAFVILSNATFDANSAVGGTGGANGQNGQGKGGAIFVYPGGVAEETNLTFSGNSSGNGGNGVLSTNGLVIDNANVYGSFLGLAPAANTVLYPVASVWTDGYGDYYVDDTATVPGEVVDWVASPDAYGYYDETALKFDLSALTGPASSAFLRIHVSESLGSPYLSVYGSPDNSWTETSMSFPMPLNSALDLNDAAGLVAGDWKLIDVTSFVNSTLSASGTASFVLTNEVSGVDDSGDGFAFDSYQSSIALLRPALLITPAAPLLTNTTLTVTSSFTPAPWGDSVTFTATVTPASGSTAPTGLVNFSDGGTLLGPVSLIASNSSAIAMFSTTNLSVGDHIISAQYAGDTNFYGSTNQVTQIVDLAAQSPLFFMLPPSQIYGATNGLSVGGGSGLGAISYIVVSGPGQIVDGNSLVITGGSGLVTVQATKAADADYAATSADATVLALPAPLTIAANPQTKIYGAAMPTLTASFFGLVNGDTSSNLTTQPTLTSSATAGSPVNFFYEIVASGAVDTNYAISYLAAPLFVTAAPLTITANNQVKIYGAALPPLTASYSGFVNGDTQASLTTQPTLITPATASSHVTGSPYIIATGGAFDPNYSISNVFGVLTVTAAPLTITANNQVKTYGAALPPLTASYSGFVNGDTQASLTTQPTLTTIATATNPVGSYAITASGAVDSDYGLTYTAGALSVMPAPLMATAVNQTRLYGQANPAFTLTYSGFVNGDTSASLTTVPSATTMADSSSLPGTYPITLLGGYDPNYIFSDVGGTLTVLKAPLSVLGNNASRAYGQPNPPFGAVITGAVPADDITALFTTTATSSSPPGSYTIAISVNDPLGRLGAYIVTLRSGILTVGSSVLIGQVQSITQGYGETNPVFTVDYSGFAPGDNASVLSGSLTFSCVDSNGVDIGPTTAPGVYAIQVVSGQSSPDYAIQYLAGALTITQAVLTVSGNDASRVYGTANPSLGGAINGFVNGETSNVLGGSLVLSTAATPSSPAGNYAIVPSGLTSMNYAIVFTNGTLLITPASLIVNVDNSSRPYGQLNPLLTGNIVGLVNGDNITATFFTLANTNSPVGPYSIQPAFIDPNDALGNYLVTTNLGTLTIFRAPLLVTADDQSRAYGSTNPPLTGSAVTVLNGDNLGLTFTTTATVSSLVGSYNITPLFSDPNGRLPNYAVETNIGALTIVTAPLVVSADNQTRVYGATNPILTGTVSGIVNSDAISATFTTTATAASPVGVYGIAPVLSDPGNKLPNYTVTTNNGTLTVTRAALLVSANNQSMAYGQPLPTLTLTYSGFVNGDTAASLTVLPTASTTATSSPGLGTYPIIPAGGSSSNYSLTYANGTLTVTKGQLTVIGNNASRAYGAADPVFTAIVTGLAAGDEITPIFTSDADSNSPPGVYDIELNLDDPLGRLGLYNVTLIGGLLTVTDATLTGTVANVSRSYGQTNPVFTVNYTGFVNGDTASNLAGILAFTCLDSNNVPIGTNTAIGSYAIHVVTGQTIANYTVHYVNGTLSVTPAVLLVTSVNQSRLYGMINPPLTATYSGFLNNDGTNVITGTPNLSASADIFSPVGTYEITASQGTLAATNYSFSFTNGVFTVGKAILTIAADNQSRTYGSTNPALTYTLSGFVDGDGTNVLTGAPSLSTAADTNSPVGNYDITVTNGTLVATNYALNFTNGTLNVTPATLTVTAIEQSRLYGSPNPPLTISYTGFVNGQDTNALSSLPTATSTADTNSSAGTYAIILTGGSDTNYNFNLVDGTLTVTPVPLVATADSQSRTYGATNPALTISYSGFVNGENAGVLQTLPTASTTAGPSSAVGSYPVTLSGGFDPDYILTLVNGALSVTPAMVVVTANNQTRPYATANPDLTFTSTGLVNGEDPSVLGITLSTAANSASPVGAYPIVTGGGTDPNYQVTAFNGVLTVASATLTVTANGATRAYGTANPPFTGTIAGPVNGNAITASFSSDALTNSPAGIYQIIPALVDPLNLASNYNVVLVDAELNIVVALVLASDPAFFVVGDGPINLDTNATVSDGDGINYAGGQLTVTIATNASAKYDLAVPSQGTGAGEIGAQGVNVSYGGVAFATLSQTSNSLVFALGTNSVTSGMLTALLRQVTFFTDDTGTNARVIRVVLDYGSNSVFASRTVLLDHPPVANDVVIVATRGVTVTIPISELLTNVTDVDGNVITLESVNAISDQGGRITSNGSTLTYSPPGNLIGNSDAFGVLYSDGHGGEAVGFVTLQFLPPNEVQINASKIASTGIQLTFSGTPDQVYQIQASTDLLNWVLLETVTATPTGIISVVDAVAKSFPHRYYRAVAQ